MHGQASDIHLSVVIPAYNEAGRIGSSLRRIRQYLAGQPWSSEVLIVVDGSRNRTTDEVRAIAPEGDALRVLENPVNRGKGFSVRRGVLASHGQFVLFCDADLSTPIEELPRLLLPLQRGYDVAIASRALPDSDVRVRQPRWRESMGRTFNWVVRLLGLSEMNDTQCGFKCFRAEAAREIFSRQRIEAFSFDVEVLWIARKLGYRVAEIPATWINHPVSRVKPLQDSVRMLLDLVRIRLNDWRGAYGR